MSSAACSSGECGFKLPCLRKAQLECTSTQANCTSPLALGIYWPAAINARHYRNLRNDASLSGQRHMLTGHILRFAPSCKRQSLKPPPRSKHLGTKAIDNFHASMSPTHASWITLNAPIRCVAFCCRARWSCSSTVPRR